MTENCVTVDQAISFLNEVNALDPTVLPALLGRRVDCNVELAYHPTVQVSANGQLPADYSVGWLGILNGLFGADSEGWGFITMRMTDGRIERFERTVHAVQP